MVCLLAFFTKIETGKINFRFYSESYHTFVISISYVKC